MKKVQGVSLYSKLITNMKKVQWVTLVFSSKFYSKFIKNVQGVSLAFYSKFILKSDKWAINSKFIEKYEKCARG